LFSHEKYIYHSFKKGSTINHFTLGVIGTSKKEDESIRQAINIDEGVLQKPNGKSLKLKIVDDYL
jgi:hypothetical protein